MTFQTSRRSRSSIQTGTASVSHGHGGAGRTAIGDLPGCCACVGHDRSAERRMVRGPRHQARQRASRRTGTTAAAGCRARSSWNSHPTDQAMASIALAFEQCAGLCCKTPIYKCARVTGRERVPVLSAEVSASVARMSGAKSGDGV
jgi:hypothetical protein